MPYIEHDRRVALFESLDRLGNEIRSAGELNYVISRLVMRMWERLDKNYDAIAGLTGILENVKQEFYRRVATPYEDRKKRENGDIF